MQWLELCSYVFFCAFLSSDYLLFPIYYEFLINSSGYFWICILSLFIVFPQKKIILLCFYRNKFYIFFENCSSVCSTGINLLVLSFFFELFLCVVFCGFVDFDALDIAHLCVYFSCTFIVNFSSFLVWINCLPPVC